MTALAYLVLGMYLLAAGESCRSWWAHWLMLLCSGMWIGKSINAFAQWDERYALPAVLVAISVAGFLIGFLPGLRVTRRRR